MRVLVVTAIFPSQLQSWLTTGLSELSRRGAHVSVLATRPAEGPRPSGVAINAILDRTYYAPCASLKEMLQTLQHWQGGEEFSLGLGAKRLLATRFGRADSYKAVIKAIVRTPLFGLKDYDVVHAHSEVAAYDYLPLIRAVGSPLVVTYHGAQPGGIRPLAPEKAREVYRHAAVVLVNTSFAAEQVQQLGCEAAKIRILPQGVDLERFRFQPARLPGPDDTISLFCAARLHEDKGLEYALGAVLELRSRGLDVRLRIAGEGPMSGALADMIRESGLGDHVELLGLLGDEDLRAEYRRAHICLLPSVQSANGHWAETQGVAIQEAQATGALVVATRSGGIPECVRDGENAFLVEQRNPAAIAARVQWLLDHKSSWPGWQAAARRWVEDHFDANRLAGDLLGIYGRVARQPGRAGQ